jgi:radical SAM superfamily enzyme YgiQ (UPF0313 family)
LRNFFEIEKLLSSEKGTYYKSFSNPDLIKVCLAYPNFYYLGMSNLGFQVIYSILNKREDVLCERTFLPENFEKYRKKNIPLFSLESKKPLFEFEILGFSLSFETDYLNILRMLSLSKIPFFSSERDSRPVLCAGGILSVINLEPISPFFDFFVIGEGEEVAGEVIEIYKNNRENFNKKKFLKEISELKGIYVPSFYEFEYTEKGNVKRIIRKENVPEKIEKRWIKNIDRFPATTSILTENTEFKNSYIIELSRGCVYKCKFCVEGNTCLPYRVRSFENVLKEIKNGLEKTKNIGLLGACVGDYPYLGEILKYLSEKNVKLQISSLRVDKIDKSLISYLKNFDVKTITLGIETPSERLLRIIGKKITFQDIQNAISLSASFEVIKLYFMIGLPFEEIEDVKILAEFLKDLKLKNKIIINITPFVPKPNTPFQYFQFEDISILKKKIQIIKEGIKDKKNFHLKIESPRLSLIQAVFSRGDRRLANVLLRINNEKISFFKAMKKENLKVENYLAEKNKKEFFPWSIIDVRTF